MEETKDRSVLYNMEFTFASLRNKQSRPEGERRLHVAVHVSRGEQQRRLVNAEGLYTPISRIEITGTGHPG